MNCLINLIEKSENIVILTHESEDADALGSAFALQDFILGLGKNVICLFSAEPEKRLNFMKGSYRVFDENDVPDADLCLCVDCADLGRIGKRKAVFDKAKNTANVDHHESNTYFADVNVVDADASAAGEIVYELICKAGAKVSYEIAENIYIAISSDSGSFKYSSVRARTMEICAQLLRIGIDHAEIARKLYDTTPMSVIKFQGRIMSSIEQLYQGRLNVVTVTEKMLAEYGIEEKDAGDIVNIPRKAQGCEIAVSIRETPEKIKISFRSNGKYNVSDLAKKIGGGGHYMAAGASVSGETVDKVKDKVIILCEDVLNGRI